MIVHTRKKKGYIKFCVCILVPIAHFLQQTDMVLVIILNNLCWLVHIAAEYCAQFQKASFGKDLLTKGHPLNLCPCSTKGLSPDPVGDP